MSEPLNITRGSIRAIVTLSVLILFIVLTIINKTPDTIVSLILALVLVMYFASRYVECKKYPPKEREEKLAEDLKIDLNK